MTNRWQLDKAKQVFTSGGVLAYPTESVYGLGCDPNNLEALQKILTIKQRPASKGLIILVSDIQQALPFIQPLTKQQLSRIQQPQLRATSWLIPRRKDLSELLCGRHQKLAVRITSHPLAKSLCEFFNSALVSTSCNLQGKPEMRTKLEVRNKMGARVDLIINGNCGEQQPSQIIDLASGDIIRQ